MLIALRRNARTRYSYGHHDAERILCLLALRCGSCGGTMLTRCASEMPRAAEWRDANGWATGTTLRSWLTDSISFNFFAYAQTSKRQRFT